MIRRKSDGKYSTGGQEPTFTRTGKAWVTARAFNRHLQQFSPDEICEIYADCEILIFECGYVMPHVSKIESYMTS